MGCHRGGVLQIFAVRFTAYRSKQFNEVMDGMIYMISSALGFAAAENVGIYAGIRILHRNPPGDPFVPGTHLFFGHPRLLHGKGKNRGTEKLALGGPFFRRRAALAL